MSSTQVQFSAKTRFFTIATAGHVDHGKTSLLRRLTGTDPDRLKEEKERQMTTDLGFAFLPLKNDVVLGFVDVPGHGKFLKNMLAGVGGIDLALLVVAADEGPMPQTKQHVRILSLLGVTRAIVAITKIDVVSEPEQIELVKEETELLMKLHGIVAEAYCPVSSTSGEGFEVLSQELKTQLEKLPARDTDGLLLLPVDRVFSKAGFGTVITGTLVSGKIAIGDQIYIEPGEMSARVRRLETHGQSVESAQPGQRVACNLVVKDGEKLSRGVVLCGAKINATKSLIVSIYDRPRLLPTALSERLSDQPIRLYHGTAEYQGYIRWVEDAESSVEGSQQGFGFIALIDGGVLSAQDRFVIRLTDDTIYGGAILLRERPRFLSKGEILELARLLDSANYDEAFLYLLENSPSSMLKEEQFSAILPDYLRKKSLSDLNKQGVLSSLGDFVISTKSKTALGKSLLEKVAQGSAPDHDDGIGLEAVRLLLHPRIERSAFQALVDFECAAARLLREGDKLCLPEKRKAQSPSLELSSSEQKIMEILQATWCLEIDELSKQSKIELKALKQSLQNLSKSGKIVVVSYDFVSSKEKIDACHKALGEIWTAKRAIAPTDFKERIGVTRKYAMALLQYFDDAKITRRLESGRVLLKAPPG